MRTATGHNVGTEGSGGAGGFGRPPPTRCSLRQHHAKGLAAGWANRKGIGAHPSNGPMDRDPTRANTAAVARRDQCPAGPTSTKFSKSHERSSSRRPQLGGAGDWTKDAESLGLAVGSFREMIRPTERGGFTLVRGDGPKREGA